MRSILFLAGAAVPALATALFPSPDGTCGPSTKFTCLGSFYGGCCDADGKCGSSKAECGTGCQSEFGWCSKGKRQDTCPAPKAAFTCPSADGTVFTLYNGDSYEIECGSSYTGTALPGSGAACADLDTCIATCSDTSSCSYAEYSNGVCTLISAQGSGSSSSGSSCAHLISKGTGSPSASASSTGSWSAGSSSGAYSGSGASGSGSSGSGSSGSGSSGSGSSGLGSSSLGSSGGYGSGGQGSYSASSAAWVSGGSSPSKSAIGASSLSSSASGSKASHSVAVGSIASSKGSGGSGGGFYGSSSYSYSLSTATPTASYSKNSSYSHTLSSYSTLSTGTRSISKSASANATSSSSSSATCSSQAIATSSSLPNCVPCQGQPGTDQFCGYDINTNSYENTPKTCKVVHYEFDITAGSVSPDGVERFAILINGQFPGPQIKASWGDTIVVKVNNQLTTNGTTIHWHGMRQFNNNGNDGVPSITQCPVAPGDSQTYSFIAENYGTSWYHSHFALQAWEGVMGPMIIEGPTSASYDVDLGTFIVQDWSHFTVDERYDLAQNGTVIPNSGGATYGGPVTMDNGLINGKNVWNGAGGNSTPVGSRFEVPTGLIPGKSYLFRFINTAIQSTFKIYLDEHEFTVIANDYVPIVPYTTNILNINVGQRYDVIVKASQTGGSYFLRADNQNACASTVQALDIKAVVRYAGADASTPTSTAYTYTDECVDEPLASLVPVVAVNAGAADVSESFEVVIAANSASLFKWYLSGTTFQSDFGDPTLVDILKNDTVPDYSGNLLINTPNNGSMVYVIIESPIPLPHPIHLHGHDFFVLGSGSGTYADGDALTLTNPPRRDTALLPGAGWLVLAFVTDNPGVWLMHCHIGWHTAMGFALQFVEMQESIKTVGALKNGCELEGTCEKWATWAAANNEVVMADSGV